MSALRLLAAMLAMAFALALDSPVRAQDGDALRFFQQNPGSSRLLFRQAPVRAPAPQVRPRGGFDEPVVRRRTPRPDADVAAPAQPEAAPVPPSVFVHVIGDSLSDSLSNGLKEHMAVERPEIAVVRRGRSSSGLVREDFHNWPQNLRDILAGADKIDLVVAMVGSNDRQALRDETGSHEFRSERWREIYVKRIDDLIAVAAEKRVSMVWVGMPVFESQRLSADMLFLNEIYKERAQRAGVPYVDVWDAFVSDLNQFAVTGPDVNGEIVRLRTSDGIHFTRAGSRKLGFFVAPEIARSIGRQAPGATAVAALPQDLSEQIRRDTPGLAPQILQGALPLPEELPALPVIRERPLQGPVIELTGAPSTPGAHLLRRRIVAPAAEMSLLVEQTLAYGRLPLPKPGRADDFSWPGDRPLN
ncbi:MAG: SGNH/GDSL hydrolase family protein [Beijerinckiaceae bacterium]